MHVVFAKTGRRQPPEPGVNKVDRARDGPTNLWEGVTSSAAQAISDVKAELDKTDLAPAGEWLEQAGKDIKHEFEKILGEPCRWAEQALKDLLSGLDKVDLGKVDAWLREAGLDTNLKATWDDIRTIKLEDLPEGTLRYIRENPGQTAFLVMNGVVYIAPNLVPGGALGLLGIKAGGSKLGKIAENTELGKQRVMLVYA